MRNPELWKPTKIRTLAAERIAVPAEAAALAPGSTLMATLVARWYRRELARHARGLLLELGAGALPYYALYRDRVSQVWCADWPASLHAQPHADLWCDLNAPLPLRDGCFDTVLLADVLEHIYRPQALLGEMCRVLRPGGTVLLNAPFMYWVHEEPHDYYRYTPYAVERMARDAGFEPLAIDAVGGSLCVLADVAGKLAQSLAVVGPLLARALQRTTLALHGELPLSTSSPLFVAAVLRRPA